VKSLLPIAAHITSHEERCHYKIALRYHKLLILRYSKCSHYFTTSQIERCCYEIRWCKNVVTISCKITSHEERCHYRLSWRRKL